MNNNIKVGDIYVDDSGFTFIVCSKWTDGEMSVMYDDGSHDTLWSIPDESVYGGSYDLSKVFQAMENAEANYMDINTQVQYAIQRMNKNVYDQDGNTRLIGYDIRVLRDSNTVLVQVYSDIGAVHSWVSVVDLLKKYTDTKPSK